MGQTCTNVSKYLAREEIFPELLHNKRRKRKNVHRTAGRRYSNGQL